MMASVAAAQEAPASDAASLEELKAQIKVMQERLQSLETKAAAKPAAAPAPATQIKWEGSPRFTDASGATFKLRGRVMLDGVNVNVDRDNAPSYKARQYRARQVFLGAEGAFGQWAYRIEGGAANGGAWGWDDAVIEYKTKSGVLLTFGNQKITGLENLTSIKSITFMERGPFGDLNDNGFVLAAQVTKVGKNWSLRGALQGDTINKADVSSGAYDANNAKERSGFAARGTWAPVMTPTDTVHLGASVRRRETGGEAGFTYAATANTAYKPQTSTGGVLLSTGAVGKSDTTVGAEAAWAHKNVSVQGEIARIKVNRVATTQSAANGGPDFNIVTGYASVSWFPTGETRPYSAAGHFGKIKIAHPIDKGGMGAFELAGRYDYADLTKMSPNAVTALASQPGLATAGTYKGLTAGVNWYPQNNVRFMANVTKAKVNNRRIGAIENDADVTVVQARMQIEF
ncbi:MAG: porin [Caulobacter sp.]|nr:porin [Caulobacter sp.]